MHCNTLLLCCIIYCNRAANELWKNSIYEYQCIDISEDMEKNAKLLQQGRIYFRILKFSNESSVLMWSILCSAHSQLGPSQSNDLFSYIL